MSATTITNQPSPSAWQSHCKTKWAGELMTLQTRTGFLVLIIWIQGNLQQLVAYGLVLHLVSSNRYEICWTGSDMADPFKLI